MCEYCEEVKLKQCQILIEDRIGIRNKTNGNLEFIPDFKKMFVPLNYCSVCRKEVVVCKHIKKNI